MSNLLHKLEEKLGHSTDQVKPDRVPDNYYQENDLGQKYVHDHEHSHKEGEHSKDQSSGEHHSKLQEYANRSKQNHEEQQDLSPESIANVQNSTGTPYGLPNDRTKNF